MPAAAKKHRNSTERAAMLADRAIAQRARVAGFYTADGKFWPRPTRMVGVAASINRRTGKPHEHNREKRAGVGPAF